MKPVIDYAPPLDGASLLAIFRLFAQSESGHVYFALRMHPPLAAQTESRIKYRYSLEAKRGLSWDAAESVLWVTSEIDVPFTERRSSWLPSASRPASLVSGPP